MHKGYFTRKRYNIGTLLKYSVDEIRKNEIKKLELKYENEDILMKKYIFQIITKS